jgi:predicted HTH domain antitoxin
MPGKTVTINIPDDFLAAVKINQQELPDFIKKTVAVELYREGILSLGKAAELAGTSNKWEMLTLLNERKVPIHYRAQDAEDDLKTLEEVVR